jgi:aminopeptidase-like protein
MSSTSTALSPGSLAYGKFFLPGDSSDEVLIAHICHPSLANDNLSGIAVALALAMRQAQRRRRLGFRVLFIPATIGAIIWLAHNEDHLDRLRHGLVLTCIGDGGRFHYKQSRSGASIDGAVAHVLHHCGHPYEIMTLNPYGALDRSYAVAATLLDLLDANRNVRTDGRGEPQLGRRGLYRAIAGQNEAGGASKNGPFVGP